MAPVAPFAVLFRLFRLAHWRRLRVWLGGAIAAGVGAVLVGWAGGLFDTLLPDPRVLACQITNFSQMPPKDGRISVVVARLGGDEGGRWQSRIAGDLLTHDIAAIVGCDYGLSSPVHSGADVGAHVNRKAERIVAAYGSDVMMWGNVINNAVILYLTNGHCVPERIVVEGSSDAGAESFNLKLSRLVADRSVRVIVSLCERERLTQLDADAIRKFNRKIELIRVRYSPLLESANIYNIGIYRYWSSLAPIAITDPDKLGAKVAGLQQQTQTPRDLFFLATAMSMIGSKFRISWIYEDGKRELLKLYDSHDNDPYVRLGAGLRIFSMIKYPEHPNFQMMQELMDMVKTNEGEFPLTHEDIFSLYYTFAVTNAWREDAAVEDIQQSMQILRMTLSWILSEKVLENVNWNRLQLAQVLGELAKRRNNETELEEAFDMLRQIEEMPFDDYDPDPDSIAQVRAELESTAATLREAREPAPQ